MRIEEGYDEFISMVFIPFSLLPTFEVSNSEDEC